MGVWVSFKIWSKMLLVNQIFVFFLLNISELVSVLTFLHLDRQKKKKKADWISFQQLSPWYTLSQWDLSVLWSSISLQWIGISLWFFACRQTLMNQTSVFLLVWSRPVAGILLVEQIWVFFYPQDLFNRLVSDFHFLDLERY